MFEIATRKKYRFPYKGQISVEDLWDLSVQNLDGIYKALKKEAKRAEEDSLLSSKSEKDTDLENKIKIVTYIVSVKQAEVETKKAEKDRALQKQKIMEIISSKMDEELHGKSVDELKAMLASLE